MSRVFTVAGITGNVGGAVAESLLAAGHQVRGVVRSVESEGAKKWEAKGVHLFPASFADEAALEKAFAGAEGVFVLAPPDFASEDPLGDAVRYGEVIKKAVISAKVPRLAFLSSFGAHLSEGTGVVLKCHLLEKLFVDLPKSESQTAAILVRAGYFNENFLSILPVAQQHGVLPSLVEGHVSLPFVSTHDIGFHTAALLADQSISKEIKIVDVIGPQWRTYAHVAQILTTQLGKPIQLTPIPRAQRQAQLEGFGIGPAPAKLIVDLSIGIEDGTLSQEQGHQQLHGSQSLEQFISQVLTKA